MSDTAAALLAAIPLFLLLSSLLPLASHRARIVTGLTAVNAIIALIFAVGWAAGWVPKSTFGWFFEGTPIGWSVAYSGTTALMFSLVTFIGWVIARYSVRYLDGESGKDRYFRWLSLTLGSVSMLVLSGDLASFWVSWIVTSLGLHQLLTHYPDRPLAARGAWTKFSVSRIGDLFLLIAITLLYRETGTLQFEAFNLLDESAASTPLMIAMVMLVIGAVMKTAQVPFHTWLPLTIETPTPVSALMHAGIVNAGGFLMIQCSGLLTLAPSAMTLLVVFGALTACYGATVMMTQTSVKSSLAYSTVAQMGFMMLQCGLGAFTAAMLHIVAHSLYKAYAFLSSGSVMERRKTMLVPSKQRSSLPWIGWLTSLVCLTALLGVGGVLFAVNLETKPGGVVLGAVLLAAMATWLADVFRQADSALLTRSLVVASALCLVYVVSLAGIHFLIADSVPTQVSAERTWTSWCFGGGILFIAVGFQWLLDRNAFASTRWTAIQIHAANGFYLDHFVRRVSRSI